MLAGLFAGGASRLVDSVGKVVDDLHTSDEERDRAALDAYRAETERAAVTQKLDLAQIDVNRTQAQSASWFVAGARPAALWICVLAFAWHYIFADLAAWAVALWGPAGLTLPQLSGADDLLTVFLALLGMSTIRGWEKSRGVARDRIGK